MPVLEYSYSIVLKSGNTVTYRASSRFPDDTESKEWDETASRLVRDLHGRIQQDRINPNNIASDDLVISDVANPAVFARAE